MLKSLFNKIAGLQACNFIKKRLQYRCFPVNIVNSLRTPNLKNICERLLLYEKHSEPSQTSKTEVFTKMVNDWKYGSKYVSDISLHLYPIQ